MILKIIDHPYEYDLKNICIAFFPFEKITVNQGNDDNIIVITQKKENMLTVDATVFDVRKMYTRQTEQNEDMAVAMSVLLYQAFSDILGFRPPWGILCGVRPVKLMHRFSEAYGCEAAKDRFINDFLVTREKAELAQNVMHYENKIIALSKPESFSLYISIPFCPTRCSYCSFVSHSIENTKKLMEPYVDKLIKELEITGKTADELHLKLETIYFGGGTPTTLNTYDLARIFHAVEKYFDLSQLREYTVEAGRPDTVTYDKLLAMKTAGITRISINPQSFNDKVLKAIGRKHTSEQTVAAFLLARECGFDNINMDFIAGLPEDSKASFCSSIDQAVDMSPESITIHTLALKSGAYLVTKKNTFDLADRMAVSQMVDYSGEKLSSAGYYPYYMYRQSKSAGNLENVGWCKEHRDCLYNVFMMDETHSVFSVGAGAVTKLKNIKNGRIERIYNYKYPYEYIDRFDEILRRKDRIKSSYKE